MKLKEIVEAAMAGKEKEFNNLEAARVTKMVSSVLQVVGSQIDGLNEGKVTVPGFGTFVIKQVTREKDGLKSTEKRVTFRLPTPK